MSETINSPLFGFAVMLAGFLIVIPAAMNLTHRVYGGGYVSAGSWIAMALFTVSFGGILTVGKLYGHPYLALIPAVISAYALMKLCMWLGMYDGWSPRKPFDFRIIRARTALYAALAVILAISAGLGMESPWMVLALGTGSASFGLAAIQIGALGFMRWREDERVRAIINRL